MPSPGAFEEKTKASVQEDDLTSTNGGLDSYDPPIVEQTPKTVSDLVQLELKSTNVTTCHVYWGQAFSKKCLLRSRSNMVSL